MDEDELARLRGLVRRRVWVPTPPEAALAARLRWACWIRSDVPVSRTPPAIQSALRDIPCDGPVADLAEAIAARLATYPHEQIVDLTESDVAWVAAADALLADVEGTRVACERLAREDLTEADRVFAGEVYLPLLDLARPVGETPGVAEVAARLEKTPPGLSPVVRDALAWSATHLRASEALGPRETARVAGEVLAVLEVVVLSQPLAEVDLRDVGSGEDIVVVAQRAMRDAERDLVAGRWCPRPATAAWVVTEMRAHPAWAMAHRGDTPQRAAQAAQRVLSTLKTQMGARWGLTRADRRLERLIELEYAALRERDGEDYSPFAAFAVGGMLTALVNEDLDY